MIEVYRLKSWVLEKKFGQSNFMSAWGTRIGNGRKMASIRNDLL